MADRHFVAAPGVDLRQAVGVEVAFEQPRSGRIDSTTPHSGQCGLKRTRERAGMRRGAFAVGPRLDGGAIRRIDIAGRGAGIGRRPRDHRQPGDRQQADDGPGDAATRPMAPRTHAAGSAATASGAASRSRPATGFARRAGVEACEGSGVAMGAILPRGDGRCRYGGARSATPRTQRSIGAVASVDRRQVRAAPRAEWTTASGAVPAPRPVQRADARAPALRVHRDRRRRTRRD